MKGDGIIIVTKKPRKLVSLIEITEEETKKLEDDVFNRKYSIDYCLEGIPQMRTLEECVGHVLPYEYPYPPAEVIGNLHTTERTKTCFLFTRIKLDIFK